MNPSYDTQVQALIFSVTTQQKTRVSTAARSVIVALGSHLIERTEIDTHAGVYFSTRKVCMRVTRTLGTPRLRIYTSVGVTLHLSLMRF